MRQRTLLIAGASLLIVGLVGLTAASLVGNAAQPPQSRRAGGVDAMFIEQMVPHHEDAIDMAELAETRAEHPELRELAERIKDGQSAENRQMREWYEDWFGEPVPTQDGRGRMRGPMMRGGGDLQSLRTAADFDKAFIEQMVPHHQVGIMMARMAGRSSRRTEIQRLTDSIVRTQSEEIDEMRRWYEEWYGD